MYVYERVIRTRAHKTLQRYKKKRICANKIYFFLLFVPKNVNLSTFNFPLSTIFTTFAPEMMCSDWNNGLEPFLSRYEQVCVVGDAAVRGEGKPAVAGLPALWLDVNEENKSLDTVSRIWDFLFENGMTRRSLLIAVGGGVLTDMAGFAAATYKRGMDYINIPTTLLAMVDASSGGKTGINYRGLKNSIGAFRPPVETLICPQWLSSLPVGQVLNGFAEMLKTGLIDGERLWDALLRYDLDTMDIGALTPLIEQCVAVKERIVAADPNEEGFRKVLNFGHTFGHALEEIQMVHGTSSNRQSSNRQLLHGYAVLYGLIAELYLSVTRLGCPQAPLQQLVQRMLQYYGRPQCKCSDRAQLIALMQQDKKNEHAAQINCTLIRSVGSPLVNQVITAADAEEALDYLFSL